MYFLPAAEAMLVKARGPLGSGCGVVGVPVGAGAEVVLVAWAMVDEMKRSEDRVNDSTKPRTTFFVKKSMVGIVQSVR